ncbi:MAG: antiporter inner membrane protein [Chloroflexi bacterium ADurb.Bin325]|nr:MAG: antiporter inner membrane protein [Chloroflexi bacterium ADurb.Bin325]
MAAGAAEARGGATPPLRIAVASGKGGTGKTTVAVSLALSLAADAQGLPPAFLDCDVEGPNAHLFLRPNFERREDVAIQIPRVDAAKCTACGRCAEVCQYHAIVVLGRRTLVFPQLCHGCGSCTLVCPEDAISEEPHVIGVLEAGAAAGDIPFARGVLNVGEPMAVPIIRQLKQWGLAAHSAAGRTAILDAPPGASCPVVETVRGADYLLFVTEPTPFGLHDLRLAADVAAELGIPAGVVINRDGIGDAAVDAFCADAGLPVLLRIPFERAIAEGVAQGRTLVEIHPEYAPRLRSLFAAIVEQAARPAARKGDSG